MRKKQLRRKEHKLTSCVPARAVRSLGMYNMSVEDAKHLIRLLRVRRHRLKMWQMMQPTMLVAIRDILGGPDVNLVCIHTLINMNFLTNFPDFSF